MKKLVSIILSVVCLCMGICFVGCVGDKQATAQDFDLTIELSTEKLFVLLRRLLCAY